MPYSPDPEHIIDELVEATVGLTSRVDEKDRLFNDLVDFIDILQKTEGLTLVTETGIKGWFRKNKPALPRNGNPTKFLLKFVVYALANKKLSEDQTEHLLAWQAVLESRVERGRRSSRRSANKPPAGSVGQWNVDDTDAPAQFRALEGDYQIIRPHSSNRDEFILEAMNVVLEEKNRQATARMYSHTQVSGEYIYHGPLFLSYRYAFVLLQRRHDLNPQRIAIRSIVLYVDAKKTGDTYAVSTCLSGLMLRGTAGQTDVARAVSVPFIALKAPSRNDFLLPQFDEVAPKLHMLHKDGNILVGESSRPSVLYDFCNRVFSRLKVQHENILYTVRPQLVREVVVADKFAKETAYFSEWSAAVRRHIAENRQ